jgi:hypothetical protein
MPSKHWTLQQEPGRRPTGPYWMLARDLPGPMHMEIYTVEHGDWGKVLPLFSSQDEARSWMGSLDKASGWRIRRAGVKELISVLSASGFSAGPCPGVERVAFDPVPGLCGEAVLEMITTSRRCFLERLMGRGRAWFESSKESKHSERRSQPSS